MLGNRASLKFELSYVIYNYFTNKTIYVFSCTDNIRFIDMDFADYNFATRDIVNYIAYGKNVNK